MSPSTGGVPLLVNNAKDKRLFIYLTCLRCLHSQSITRAGEKSQRKIVTISVFCRSHRCNFYLQYCSCLPFSFYHGSIVRLLDMERLDNCAANRFWIQWIRHRLFCVGLDDHDILHGQSSGSSCICGGQHDGRIHSYYLCSSTIILLE